MLRSVRVQQHLDKLLRAVVRADCWMMRCWLL